jgi:DNA transformation protein
MPAVDLTILGATMASRQDTVDYLLDQISGAGRVSAKKMFGEYGIYCDGKIVALVCDDQLYVKPTPRGRDLIWKPREAAPYPGAKPYFLVTGDRWEDADWLAELIGVTAKELPAPKPKVKKAPKTKKSSKPKNAKR